MTDIVSKGGNFMEHSDLRKEEIIKACTDLYDKYNFKDITIKLISEEIFLALFQKEYEKWQDEVDAIRNNNESLTKDEFAEKLAHTLEDKERLLKLLSMNMYDLEENSRIERLTEFKKAYGNAVHAVRLCLNKFFKDMGEEDTIEFIYSFFPFMFGIYPYASVTKKQKQAMKEAGIKYKYFTIYEIAYMGIRKLLG